MKAFRIQRTTTNVYLVRPMFIGSKLYKSLNEGYQRFFNEENQQYSDFEMYCNAQSLPALLDYIYNDLGTCVYGNNRHYKTVAGAAKYILNNK
jgi:hypothetical protein